MGGVINVAIRFADGRTVCQERWTNNMPHWFQNPKMFAGDEAHVQGYIDMTKNNDWIADPYAPGRPQPVENSEYGLIVWDYVTNVILDNNHYSDPVTFDPIFTGGERVRETFLECAKAGIMRMRTVTFAPLNTRVPGEYLKELSTVVTDLLSPEDALRLGEEAHAAQRAEYRSDRSDDVPWERVDFIIDTSPMTYISFGDHADVEYDEETQSRPLSPEYLAKLKEIGFPMTAEEGLNTSLTPVPEAREISETEKTARNLYQKWKQAVPPAGDNIIDGRTYDGVSFDDAPEVVRKQLMDRAGNMTKEQLRDMALADMLGSSSMVAKIKIGEQ